MIFRDMLMKLLKRYLIVNLMNSDIIVAQHPIIQNDVKIILYAYTQSVFSGRRIEKLLHDSIRMMWLAQNQTPSYKTINRFRVNPNTDALIESLFIQFHSQCLKQNLIDDNSIFIDGTKVEASAIGFVLMALNIRKIAAQRAVHYKMHIKKLISIK